MTRIDQIITRCESPEFKAVAEDVAAELWEVINTTILGHTYAERIGEDHTREDEDWDKFYLPALRHGIHRRLADKCRAAEEGWLEAFCNSVREASERG